MTFKNYRDESRKSYGIETETGVSIEAINAGSLQRIADATELMARNYQQLQNDLDRYKRWYDEECERRKQLERRVNSLKGVITKLRKVAKQSNYRTEI